MTEALRDSNEPTTRPRWRVPTITCAVALIVHLLGQRMVDDDISMQSAIAFVAWLLAFLVIGVWWMFFSGMRWRTRLAGVGGVVLFVVALLSLFRFEGQTGNFLPQFRFRFANSAEDQALAYFAKQTPPSPPAPEAPGDGDIPSSADRFPTTDADWPNFGGPQFDHVAHGESVRTDWEANPPRALWRHPVGPGWSSFAVAGDYVFTQEQRGEQECVVCYDANTGEQRWVHSDEARFEEAAGGAGPRATPTLYGSRLYALGASGILNCLDPLTGTVHWSHNVVTDNGGDLIEWAAAGSPVVHEDLVIVNPATSAAFLAAYDRHSGEQRWSGPEAKAGYATPVVATIDDVPQIVMVRAAGVGGHSVATGEQLWFFEWVNATRINVAQPIVLPDNTLFISTGYGGGSARLEVKRSEQTWSVASLWERPNKFKLKFNAGIFRDGHVYGLDEGILSCFDVNEGQRTWKKGRYKFGQILMVDDRLLVLTEEGDVVLVEATPEAARELARFTAIEGKTWNHPVLNRGRLFVRNGSEAARYDLRPDDGTNTGPTPQLTSR